MVYLRGGSKYSNNLIEVLFDYIGCIVFFTRLIAQWVRIILVLISFFSLSHVIVEFQITNQAIIGNDVLTGNNYGMFSNRSLTYYLLVVFPGKFLHLIYEVLHTISLIISQFISFFSVVFWLFLFLYTFFIIEKHEDYFSRKREEKIIKLKKIYNLKGN